MMMMMMMNYSFMHSTQLTFQLKVSFEQLLTSFSSVSASLPYCSLLRKKKRKTQIALKLIIEHSWMQTLNYSFKHSLKLRSKIRGLRLKLTIRLKLQQILLRKIEKPLLKPSLLKMQSYQKTLNQPLQKPSLSSMQSQQLMHQPTHWLMHQPTHLLTHLLLHQLMHLLLHQLLHLFKLPQLLHPLCIFHLL